MHAQVIIVDSRSKGHRFKGLEKHVVNLKLTVFAQDLSSERKMLGHRSTFMISSK
jgi:hypothetical protein